MLHLGLACCLRHHVLHRRVDSSVGCPSYKLFQHTPTRLRLRLLLVAVWVAFAAALLDEGIARAPPQHWYIKSASKKPLLFDVQFALSFPFLGHVLDTCTSQETDSMCEQI